MIRDDFSKLYWLNREISREKQRLEELKTAAANCTAKISGLPHASGQARQTEDMAILIAEQEDLINLKIKQSMIEYNRLNRYIADVDDPLMRSILALRFVNGLPWRQVAMSIGGNNTADSVRKACIRFLDRAK